MGKVARIFFCVLIAIGLSRVVEARFLSADPKPPAPGDIFGFNRYAYANNNPIMFTDPNGQNAIITHNADGSINIQVPINFSGPAASAQNINFIKSDAASHWSRLYNVAGEITKVTVAVTDVNSSTPKGAINNVTLLNGPTSNVAAQGASFVNPDHVSGEWNMNQSAVKVGMTSHELGHLMGDKDYYNEGKDANGSRITPAFPGYENNLMGALNAVSIPDSRNMDVILNSSINIKQNAPPPPPPPPPPPKQQ